MSPRLLAQLHLDIKGDAINLDKLRRERSENFLAGIAGQAGRLWALLSRAEELDQISAATHVHNALIRLHRLEAEVLGQFDRSVPHVLNITLTAEWLDFRREILATLAKFPEARRAIAASMARIEDQQAKAPAVVEHEQHGPQPAA